MKKILLYSMLLCLGIGINLYYEKYHRCYIIRDVVYKDYWMGNGYVFEKERAQRFTKEGAENVRQVLWNRSEYCDGPEMHDSPIVIEHVSQVKPTPNPWSERNE